MIVSHAEHFISYVDLPLAFCLLGNICLLAHLLIGLFDLLFNFGGILCIIDISLLLVCGGLDRRYSLSRGRMSLGAGLKDDSFFSLPALYVSCWVKMCSVCFLFSLDDFQENAFSSK